MKVTVNEDVIKIPRRKIKSILHDPAKSAQAVHLVYVMDTQPGIIRVKRGKDIPGQDLFQYYDEKGEHHSIESGMVNEYIHKLSGSDFTAKDFRTWAGTVQAILERS